MKKIEYTVACTFENPVLAARWLAWLEDHHLADVCAAGAIQARVVRPDGDPIRLEVRYLFPSRQTFDTYLRDHAPRLRQEGLREFPLELGLAYERFVGEVELRHP
jgi:hypothetical protein